MPSISAVVPRLAARRSHSRAQRPLPAQLPAACPAAAAPLDALQRRLHGDAAKVQQGRLHPWCASFLQQSVDQPPRAMVLLLHGFTAGPWQYFSLSQRLCRGGVDVYAPRLPGHGRLQHGEPAPHKMPGIERQDRYRAWAEEVYQEAKAYSQARGLPLRLMGFSLGGGLAADLAGAHPHGISTMVAAAPFLRPKPLKGRLGFAAARLAQRVDCGRSLLCRRDFAWVSDLPDFLPRPLPGYWRFPLSKMYGCLDYN
ncbi:MAG: alpha/beta fold hydrolase, partial [Hymenobacter sp.]